MSQSNLHLILGGQRSGKSAYAEYLTSEWFKCEPLSSALMLATAKGFDEEMKLRILRHQQDRLLKLPQMKLIEEPINIAECVSEQSSAKNLIVIDCITVWLTNLLMPHPSMVHGTFKDASSLVDDFFTAIEHASGPVVMISNEIGLGVIPLGQDVRHYVDQLGRLNQRLARICGQVTLMVSGIPMSLKSI